MVRWLAAHFQQPCAQVLISSTICRLLELDVSKISANHCPQEPTNLANVAEENTPGMSASASTLRRTTDSTNPRRKMTQDCRLKASMKRPKACNRLLDVGEDQQSQATPYVAPAFGVKEHGTLNPSPKDPKEEKKEPIPLVYGTEGPWYRGRNSKTVGVQA